MKRTLITSALPYANGYLHLGHCAGAYLPADIYARYLRLKGEEVLYVCGSDEHGVAITIAAEKEKVKPKDIIDKYHEANKEAFNKIGMTFDIYSRTSIPLHHETAKEFFKYFLENGFLNEKTEKQFYDEQAKMFLPDRYVEGTCPNCNYDKARGDQCDSCGAYYNQLELKNPISLVSGKKPFAKETVHWYMRFDKLQKFLEEYVESHSKDWKENVLQQTRSWLKQGLNERAITRDLTWGVKINDIDGIDRDKAKGKALYVWFEAVLGYISATKQLMNDLDRDNEWEKWWKDEDTRYIAFIGKDNIVFHTLIFPAILHAKGGYILPDNVPANEFLNLEGQKFSKSRNWSIDLKDYIADFRSPQAMDALRYTLAMSFPETKDSDFTWKDFQSRNNNELSAIFGNFVNRTLQFIAKNFEGRTPILNGSFKDYEAKWKAQIENFETLFEESGSIDDTVESSENIFNDKNEYDLIASLWQGIRKAESNYSRFRFRDGINETMNIARAANKYFNDEEPWKSSKNDPDASSKTLFFCVQMVRSLSILFAPVVPFACQRINRFLGLEPQTGVKNSGTPGENYWVSAMLPSIDQGLKLNKPELLFERIEDSTVDIQVSKLGDKESLQDELISIDDFMKIKLRSAEVLEAEKIAKSKKLLKLKVKIGDETRQIIAGIAEHYEPEQMIGKKVVVVANLKPAKLMGLESQGMLLAANTKEKLSVIIIDDESIASGAEVR